jgi:putative membrane protein
MILRRKTDRIAGLVLALPLAMLSCGGDAREPAAPEPAPPEPLTMTPAMRAEPVERTPDADEAVPIDPAPTAPPVEKMSDAQIADVISSANQGEIEQAKQAQKKARNARVKKFAAMMIQHHGDAQKKLAAVTKKLMLSSSPSALQSEVQSGGASVLDKLKTMTGADFDIAYMDAQVTQHEAVLDALDRKLAPQAETEEMRTLLSELRPVIEKHLTEARDIVQLLSTKDAGKNAPTADVGAP